MRHATVGAKILPTKKGLLKLIKYGKYNNVRDAMQRMCKKKQLKNQTYQYKSIYHHLA